MIWHKIYTYMSLLTLRNNYIDPAILEKTIFHGHQLHGALDGDDDDLVKEIVEGQSRIDQLLILKELVAQSYHTANNSETIKGYYEQANDLGLDAQFNERDVIAQTEVKTTKLQKQKKRGKSKGQADSEAPAEGAPAKAKAKGKTTKEKEKEVDVRPGSRVILIRGDIRTVLPEPLPPRNNDYIVHQTNGTGTRASGVAEQIFNKFPQSNIYSKRKPSDRTEEVALQKMGGIEVTKPVIAIMGQLRPGPAKDPETPAMRLGWFRSALEALAKRINSGTLAVGKLYFPHGIGCGLAKGKWGDYSDAISSFAESVPNQVYIVKLVKAQDAEMEVAPATGVDPKPVAAEMAPPAVADPPVVKRKGTVKKSEPEPEPEAETEAVKKPKKKSESVPDGEPVKKPKKKLEAVPEAEATSETEMEKAKKSLDEPTSEPEAPKTKAKKAKKAEDKSTSEPEMEKPKKLLDEPISETKTEADDVAPVKKTVKAKLRQPAPVAVEVPKQEQALVDAPVAPAKKKATLKTKYLLRTGPETGIEIGLKYKSSEFGLITKGSTDEDIDAVMKILATGEDAPENQVSSALAIRTLLGEEPSDAVVKLHAKLKAYVTRY